MRLSGGLFLTPLILAAAPAAAADGVETEKASRITPYSKTTTGVRKISPPTMNVTLVREAPLPTLLTAALSVDHAEKCMQIVSPQMAVDGSILANDGWGWSGPKRQNGPDGPFESVEYSKDGMVIALLDFGPVVACRTAGFVSGPNEVDAIRSALTTRFNATALDKTDRLEDFSKLLAQTMPEINQDDVLIAGAYQIEIAVQKVDPADMATNDIPSDIIAMVTINPLAPKYQARLHNTANE